MATEATGSSVVVDDGEKKECVSDAHKRPQLGFDWYCNSKEFSDVTIRFGAQGERVFHAHKVVLCARSHWFRAALSGNFQEGHSKEIVLHDDDPDALQKVLELAYGEEDPYIDPPSTIQEGTHEAVLYYLGLLELIMFHKIAPDTDLNFKVDHWRQVIHKIYDMPVGLSNEVRRSLYMVIAGNGIYGKDMGPVIKEVAKEHAEFGRDLMIGTTG
ncbi:BTB/POZ protein [Massariosphaeria phaeospora]|uniref:BTB/POZ protein n=1 Tax=Massariosphaeria phaeospora TaxID=100035 RepID=A0A7C8M7R8_9PLEO|nr:BTB/POZ protein [Massariosphaeria phaeospora]